MKKVFIIMLIIQSTAIFAQRRQLPAGFTIKDAMKCRNEIQQVGCGRPKDDPDAFKKCIQNKGYSDPSDVFSKKCQNFINIMKAKYNK